MNRSHSAFACAIAFLALTLAACAAEGSPARNYSEPPRCGPRNCVAMCVTCFYDICRIGGGSAAECNAEKEVCKDECNQGEECTGDPTRC